MPDIGDLIIHCGDQTLCIGRQTWPFLLAAIVSVFNHLATIAHRKT